NAVRDLLELFAAWQEDDKRRSDHSDAGAMTAFLANCPECFLLGSDHKTRYAEILMATERLISKRGLPFQQPSLTATQYEQGFLSAQARALNPGRPLAALVLALARGYRFLPYQERRQHSILYLDEPVDDLRTMFELIAQSPTGEKLLRELLPLVRKAQIHLNFHQGGERPVSLRPSHGKVVLSIRSGTSALELLEPLVFELAQGMGKGFLKPFAGQSASAHPTQLMLLRFSLSTTRSVLSELAISSPEIAALHPPAFGDLLFRRSGVRFDLLGDEEDRRTGWLCRVALAIAGDPETSRRHVVTESTNPE
ncbi:hypothetical protein K2X33_08005, partial [bacterium]|nr:hypothetical protein [bacterium]